LTSYIALISVTVQVTVVLIFFLLCSGDSTHYTLTYNVQSKFFEIEKCDKYIQTDLALKILLILTIKLIKFTFVH
jgi:hypothetical protein